jgi:hypothetical protein
MQREAGERKLELQPGAIVVQQNFHYFTGTYGGASAQLFSSSFSTSCLQQPAALQRESPRVKLAGPHVAERKRGKYRLVCILRRRIEGGRSSRQTVIRKIGKIERGTTM